MISLLGSRFRSFVPFVVGSLALVAFAEAQAPRAKPGDPDAVSESEAQSFAAFVAGAMVRQEVDAVFAKVDVDDVLASTLDYFTLADAQRKKLRAEVERRARALLAAGPAVLLAVEFEDEYAEVRLLQFHERGTVDVLDLALGHAADGGMRITNLWSHRQLESLVETASWLAVASGAQPSARGAGLRADADKFRANYRAFESVKSAPAEKRAAALARNPPGSPGYGFLVREFLVGTPGSGAQLDAELARWKIAPGAAALGRSFLRFDRALERRDSEAAFAAVEELCTALGSTHGRGTRALESQMRGVAWRSVPDLALAEESFEHAVLCEPALDPAWRALVELALGRRDEARACDLLVRWNTARPHDFASFAKEPAFEAFARSRDGARWKEQFAAGAPTRAGDAPAELEVADFAFALEAAFSRGDKPAIRTHMSLRRVVENALAGIEMSDKLRRDLVTTAANMHQLEDRYAEVAGSGGRFELVRVRTRGGRPTALFLMRTAEGGVDWIEFDVVRARDGGLEADEWYSYSLGDKASTVLRRAYLPLIASRDTAVRAKLGETDGLLVTHADVLRQLIQASDKGEHARVLELCDALPDVLKRDKLTLRVRLKAAQQLDESSYEAVLADMQRILGDDPCMDLVALDLHLLRRRFDLALLSVERVDQAIGGDSYCDSLRAGVLLQQEKFADAARVATRALRRGCGSPEPLRTLVSCQLREKRFDAALELMITLTDRFDFEWGDLHANAEFAGFVASATHARWVAYAARRDADPRRDDEESDPRAK